MLVLNPFVARSGASGKLRVVLDIVRRDSAQQKSPKIILIYSHDDVHVGFKCLQAAALVLILDPMSSCGN